MAKSAYFCEIKKNLDVTKAESIKSGLGVRMNVMLNWMEVHRNPGFTLNLSRDKSKRHCSRQNSRSSEHLFSDHETERRQPRSENI